MTTGPRIACKHGQNYLLLNAIGRMLVLNDDLAILTAVTDEIVIKAILQVRTSQRDLLITLGFKISKQRR